MRAHSIAEALAAFDRIVNDKIRAFQTAVLFDVPADGGHVDADWLGEAVGRMRAECARERERLRSWLMAETFH